MPKYQSVDGVEVQYDSHDDGNDNEDEQIDVSLLPTPKHELLVDRYKRPIIMPYTSSELQPQKPATKAINTFIVRADEAGYNQFWNGFRSQVTWLRKVKVAIEDIFNKKASKRLSNLLYGV